VSLICAKLKTRAKSGVTDATESTSELTEMRERQSTSDSSSLAGVVMVAPYNLLCRYAVRMSSK
jgi:hypothetical protein